MRYGFEAVSPTGARERGDIAAPDERTALKALAARGLTVLILTPQPEATKVAASTRLNAGDRALAIRQLSGLIDGGVTLPNALASVAANSGVGTVTRELNAVNAALNAGDPIAAAFEKAPRLLPTVERQVVVAGAEAGDLARVLSRLADTSSTRRIRGCNVC